MSFEQKKYWESGVMYERERILKLLDDEIQNADFSDERLLGLFEAIELIKRGRNSTAWLCDND
jgi:hypothetical protein